MLRKVAQRAVQTRAISSRFFASRAKSTFAVADNSEPFNPFEVQPGCLQPGLPATEFLERRKKLFASMPDNSALIANAAEVKYMTHDIPWEFHQNSNFMYLTGLEEPDAHAVLLKSQNKCSFVLFVRPRDPHSEQWDGARVGLDGAKHRYLADDAFQLTDLSPAMHKLLSSVDKVFVLKPDGGRYSPTFVDATKTFHSKFFAGDFLVEQLRVVKSENELNRMRFAADIGAQGFIDMMKNTRPGMSELALGSTFEGSIKKNGALWNAFPNVVGSGANAAVVHYLSKRDLLRENDLVLVDSGCEVAGGYASDITRTWPVGGKLSSGQELMYEFVLDVQKKCLEHLKTMIESKEPITLNELHDYSVDIMMKRMLEFGILKNKSGPLARSAIREFQKYNPTHVGHYLGLDTHDTPHVTRSAPLVPGMVVTVEPGIYLPKNDFDLPEELRGIGIRIEDDVVITDSGIEITTTKVPKELQAMEALRYE
ncbi:xaa-Pro aminopeptidase, putative [Phytophthora infestans T30-4]|uniref:Xaa-Pro aminopeptidase, putative n=1 Tax=Phytophthora infestans (strain T30-4) TaxID=403677 RepID=D0MUW9_PHYIT|nr:xaa-Pro aminopeptidase, putative [Phytophthora infestans T30-4]EEY60965.1 xaa-Pro aminopeptidase, putative [Phytophthora infestans T30-4]|eukprot:XP_002907882.1 xaa-Pro aminopeptidase, putative [Phytophthora infestans T30-4]